MSSMLEALLRIHELHPSDLDPVALQRIAPDDAEGEQRLVRLAITNRELRRHGLPPLLLQVPQREEEEEEEDAASAAVLAALPVATLSEAEEAGLRDVGLSEEQYHPLRGTYGSVLGLQLNPKAFKAAMAACRTKRALACLHDESASRAHLRLSLRRLAVRAASEKGKKGLPKRKT